MGGFQFELSPDVEIGLTIIGGTVKILCIFKLCKGDIYMKIRDMVFTALLAATICICAPFTIPVGVIPISLATFAIYIASTVIGFRQGIAAVITYIIIGAVGLPVFSGFTGGFSKLVGITGGYIVGYIFLAAISGYIVDKNEKAVWVYPVGMIAGTTVLYIFGSMWFMFTTKSGVASTLAVCVVPFLIGDALKIAAASVVSFNLRKTLKNYSGSN